jgi:hypothetical protein
MGINFAHDVQVMVGKIFVWVVGFGRNSWISSVEVVETGKKREIRTDTAVPKPIRGRYYSYSKPGGPLSQDTHTSSGLSIYGLGVGT